MISDRCSPARSCRNIAQVDGGARYAWRVAFAPLWVVLGALLVGTLCGCCAGIAGLAASTEAPTARARLKWTTRRICARLAFGQQDEAPLLHPALNPPSPLSVSRRLVCDDAGTTTG